MIPSGHVDHFTRENLPPQAEWPDLLLSADYAYPDRLNASVELLDRTVDKVGREKIALIGAEGQISYGELLIKVKTFAQFLEAEGVVAGNRVLIRGPNNISVVVYWLAVLRIGAVAVTTIPLQRAAELEKIVAIASVQFALVDHRFQEEWDAVKNFHGKTLVYDATNAYATELAKNFDGQHVAADTASDDVSILAFTSGSTGLPKATMHFHRDHLIVADSFSHHILKPNSNDIFAGSPPIAFTFGLGALVNFPLRIGATSLLIEAASPPQLLEKIAEHKVTCLFTAPTAYRAMLPYVTSENVATLRRCVSAGEHLPKSTWEQWNAATGIKLIDGIGATELLHIFISASDDEIIPGMTGKPVPGYQAKVVDANFVEVARGSVGFLAVKGPTGCRYLSDERQQKYVVDGWNLTGDLYIMLDNGYLQYQARSDDMIISSGYNIAAPEVENAILAHSAVQEVAVIGVPDEERGMLVTAYVVLNPGVIGDHLLLKEIQDFVKQTIAPFKYPRQLFFVETLPKTTTGKIQRFRLKNDPVV